MADRNTHDLDKRAFKHYVQQFTSTDEGLSEDSSINEAMSNSKLFTLRAAQSPSSKLKESKSMEKMSTPYDGQPDNGVINMNAYCSNFIPQELPLHKTPSFNSLASQRLDGGDNLTPLCNNSFSEVTKDIISKELLKNMKSVSKLTADISHTISQYKEYYKVDKLETQHLKLNILLHQSFNQAFAQIVDLSAQLTEENIGEIDSEVRGSEEKQMKDDLKELKHKYKKMKHSFKDKCAEIREKQEVHEKECTHFVKTIQAKDKEIMGLKEYIDSQTGTYSHSDNSKLMKEIKRLENEREQARIYAKELEEELQQTKQDLYDNKVNLIAPLKEKLSDLENIIQSKEQKIKRVYRRKLRKYRKELHNEKKINISLAKRISLFNPDDRSISDIDFETESHANLYYTKRKQSKSQLDVNRSKGRFNQFETYADLKQYKEIRTLDTSENENDRNLSIPKQISYAASGDLDGYNQPRRQKSYYNSQFNAYQACSDNKTFDHRIRIKHIASSVEKDQGMIKNQRDGYEKPIGIDTPCYNTQNHHVNDGSKTDKHKKRIIHNFKTKGVGLPMKVGEGMLRDITHLQNVKMGQSKPSDKHNSDMKQY